MAAFRTFSKPAIAFPLPLSRPANPSPTALLTGFPFAAPAAQAPASDGQANAFCWQPCQGKNGRIFADFSGIYIKPQTYLHKSAALYLYRSII
jgi:hypothetical protein